MNKTLAATLKLSALSLALIAAGCGGGGGSTAPASSNVVSSAPTRDVQGTAAKGIIKGATVRIYSLDASGQKSAAPIASTTTGADGSFKASIGADVLQFVIEVSAAAGATMADEATGTDLPVPANMVIRTVATLAQNAGSYTGSVTPLTELAVKTAEKSAGGLTVANIAAAKAGVRAAFGFDPETVTPVNSNSAEAANASVNQKTQALLLAALSKMAKDGSLGCASADVKCVVEQFANSATLSGAGLSLGDTGTKIAQAVQKIAADPAINHTGATSIELPTALTAPAVTPALPPVADTPVAAAKKLFASLRTNVAAIAQSRTGLEDRAKLVKADFSMLVAPVDEELQHLITIPSFAVDYFTDYKAGLVTAASATDSRWYDTCTIYSDAASTIVATSAANALNIVCPTNRKTVSFSYTAGSFIRKDVVQVMTITPGTGRTHSYSATTQVETYVNNVRQSTVELIGNYGNGSQRATGTVTYAAKSSTGDFAVSGSMPARTDSNGVKLTDYEQWDLTASRQTDTVADTATFTIAGTMSSYLNGAAAGKLTVNGGATLGLHDDRGGAKSLDLTVSAEAGASAMTGTLHLADWMHDKKNVTAWPTSGRFEGALTQGGSPFFSGVLSYKNTGFDQFDTTLDFSANNFVAQTLTLQGELAIPQRPSLKLSLSLTESAIGSDAIVAQYDDGSSVINLNASRVTDANGTNSAATFASTTGVSVAFTGAELGRTDATVPVLKDSAEVARLNLKTGVISYTDGTVESLQ